MVNGINNAYEVNTIEPLVCEAEPELEYTLDNQCNKRKLTAAQTIGALMFPYKVPRHGL